MKDTITILVDVPSNRAYYRDVISGVARFCRECPQIRLRFSSDEWDMVGSKLPVHGVIAVVSDEASLLHATRHGAPVVNISSRTGVVDVPSVVSDNWAIGALAADHLLKEGYTFFASHMTSGVQFSIDRAKGFKDRVVEAGYSSDEFDTAVSAVPYHQSAVVVSEMIAWLQRLKKPVGLFTHNDIRGVMLLDLCREANIDVPGQVGVISVDNDEFLDLLPEPTLSSVNPNARAVGHKAAEVLMSMIRDEALPAPRTLIKPLHVVQRESTQLIFDGDEMLGRAVRYIRKHAVPSLTIREVLAEVPISRRVLERRFRERLGLSPADEILRVRMERAKSLLSKTTRPLKQVASDVGYSEYPNFAIAFRREVGASPNDFRRNNSNPNDAEGSAP